MGSNPSVQRHTKKPVTVEAILLDDTTTPSAAAAWCGGRACGVGDLSAKQWIEIDTLEGVMRASYGDYIIKGVDGEFYPCKPDIFERTYSPAVPVVRSPSKWFFAKYRSPESNVPIGVVVDDDQDLVIAEVYELEGVNNGPLMAMAPELLKALKDILSAIPKDNNDRYGFAGLLVAANAASFILAKAEATNVR